MLLVSGDELPLRKRAEHCACWQTYPAGRNGRFGACRGLEGAPIVGGETQSVGELTHRVRSGLRPLAAPAAFFLQLTLAITVGDLLRRAARARPARAFLVQCGSVSMALYLFHIYFVSGSRLALSKLFHAQSLTLHLALGWALGLGGPWLLWRTLRNNRLFLVSVGMAREERRDGPPVAAPLCPQPA